MIRFLAKGLWRDPTRSLFPFLTVTTGVMVTVLLQTYLAGISSNLSWSSARFSSGHLRVTSRAAAEAGDQASNELALTRVGQLLEELRRDASDLQWAPRIRFGGLLDIPDARGFTKAQAPISGFGIELSRAEAPDRRVLSLESAIVRGRLPVAPGEALISEDLARHLNIEPGATATLIGSTMYGAMASANFTIAGTLRFGVRAMDRGTMVADVRDIQRALEMDDAAGEILGFYPDTLYRRPAAEATADGFNARQPDTADEFGPTMVPMSRLPGIVEFIDLIDQVSVGIVVAFTFVMSIVLWNAGLIGGLRRYGEVGVRLAFGEGKGRLYRAMLIESLLIGLLGSVVGTLLALGPAYWLQSRGWDIGYMMQNASLMMQTVIRAQITPATFVIGFLPGLVATGIGTALSGRGIYKRQTASLMKELEV